MDYDTLKKQAALALGIDLMGRVAVLWFPFAILLMIASVFAKAIKKLKLSRFEVIVITVTLILTKIILSM